MAPVLQRLARPIDAAWLVAARFVFGMTMFVSIRPSG